MLSFVVPSLCIQNPLRRMSGAVEKDALSKANTDADTAPSPLPSPLQLAFLGNSMFYYHDCPRLLEQMLKAAASSSDIQQDSCLRGGATLSSLWVEGNGMMSKFASPAALLLADSLKGMFIQDQLYDVGAPSPYVLLSHDMENPYYLPSRHSSSEQRTWSDNKPYYWDFVLFNDHTQYPARDETRQDTLKVLQEHYLPLLKPQTTVIFVQTPAYQVPGLRDTDDLGDFSNFTSRLLQGYEIYQQTVLQVGIPCRIAPVGNAYQYVKEKVDETLWNKLYNRVDHFHPSPHGTWLQACVLYATITQQPMPPAVYRLEWWKQARYRQPLEQNLEPIPTLEEAETLRAVAWNVVEEYNNRHGKIHHQPTADDQSRL